MINITYDYILKELKTKRAISVLSIFSLLGFVIPFIPFFVIETFDIDAIISFIFLFLVFGLPFGYFMGLRNILNTLKIYRDIKNCNFVIWLDRIADMKVSKNGRASEMDDSYCKLYLEKYSKDKKSTVSVWGSKFLKLKKGDNCTLVFVNSEKYPILVFAGNNYSVDKHLEGYLSNNVEVYE